MSDVRSWMLDDLIGNTANTDSAQNGDGRRPRHAAVDPDAPTPPPPSRPRGGAHARPAAGSHARPTAGAHARPGTGPDRRTILAIGGTAAVAAACTGSSHVRKVAGGLLNTISGGGSAAEPASGAPLAVPVLPTTTLPGSGAAATAAGAVNGGSYGGAGNGIGFVDRDASYSSSAPAAAHVAAAAPGAVRSSPSAASTARPSVPTPLSVDAVEHLLARFSFGATPALRAEVRRLGTNAWVNQQLAPGATGYSGVPFVASAFPQLAQSGPQARAALDNKDQPNGNAMDQLSRATIAQQMWSPHQLYERMVDFWANHLAVANHSDNLDYTRHVFDRDVVRRYALGKFSDMLLASAKSPAMLVFLNQNNSSKEAPNENYARELMELHTLGVSGGYTETDVQSVAKLLTGRTVRDDAYTFDAGRHFVGPIKALAFTSPNGSAAGGEAAGDAFLGYLARHTSTAHMIARKLAVRFVADAPPVALIERLAKVYLANDTAIVPVLRALFASTEFWASRGQKTRRPAENVVAAARALGAQPGATPGKGLGDIVYTLSRMNNAPMDWRPPNGYPDVAAAWVSSGTMVGLWRAHRDLAGGGLGNPGVSYPKIETIWGGPVPATTGAAVDALSTRLVGQRLPAAQRAALLAFLGAGETTPVRTPDLGGQLTALVPLLFDSIFHALR